MKNPLEKADVRAPMIDSHFHSLEMEAKGLDAGTLLDWCFESGLTAALDVSVTPENLADRQARTGRFRRVRYAAGYYPSESKRFASDPAEADSMLAALETALSNERVVALGEIGLDAFHDYAPMATQQELFRAQLAVAAARSLPVVIHNRETDREVFESVSAAGLPRGGVMHCFTSDYSTAKRFIDLGFFISFAGNLTFRNAADLQAVARRLPSEALLVETDSPYLAPVPARGAINHPGYIGHTYAYLAQVRGEDLHELSRQIEVNFMRLFALSDIDG